MEIVQLYETTIVARDLTRNSDMALHFLVVPARAIRDKTVLEDASALMEQLDLYMFMPLDSPAYLPHALISVLAEDNAGGASRLLEGMLNTPQHAVFGQFRYADQETETEAQEEEVEVQILQEEVGAFGEKIEDVAERLADSQPAPGESSAKSVPVVMDSELFSFAEQVAFTRLIPFEESPFDAHALASIVATGSGTAIGAIVGYLAVGTMIPPLLFVTVPLGMIICGAAAGVAKSLEEGLRSRILKLLEAPEDKEATQKLGRFPRPQTPPGV